MAAAAAAVAASSQVKVGVLHEDHGAWLWPCPQRDELWALSPLGVGILHIQRRQMARARWLAQIVDVQTGCLQRHLTLWAPSLVSPRARLVRLAAYTDTTLAAVWQDEENLERWVCALVRLQDGHVTGQVVMPRAWHPHDHVVVCDHHLYHFSHEVAAGDTVRSLATVSLLHPTPATSFRQQFASTTQYVRHFVLKFTDAERKAEGAGTDDPAHSVTLLAVHVDAARMVLAMRFRRPTGDTVVVTVWQKDVVLWRTWEGRRARVWDVVLQADHHRAFLSVQRSDPHCMVVETVDWGSPDVARPRP